MDEPRSIRLRVENAFDPTTRGQYGQRYLDALYANWLRTAAAARRSLLLVLLLVTSFLLLAHAKSAQFSLGPLRLTNIAAILTLIPAIASYVLFEFFSLAVAAERSGEAFRSLMRLLYPTIVDNDLETLLLPPAMHMMEVEQGWRSMRLHARRGRAAELAGNLTYATIVFLVFGGFAFLVYAYITLYSDSHANAAVVSVSLAVTMFNVTRYVLDLADDSHHDARGENR